MPSTFKTTNLGLNVWLGSDKPTRSDFVKDNNIIDNKLGSHINNADKHLSTDQKTRLDSPYEIQTLQGNGEEIRTVELSFQPKIAVCFAVDTPSVITVNNILTVSSAIAVNNTGGSGGLVISENSVKVKNETDGNAVYNLNQSGVQYILIVFR